MWFMQISNLFAKDEIDDIMSSLTQVMKKEYPKRSPTIENLYAYFITRARSNLHIVLCFSPVSTFWSSVSILLCHLFYYINYIDDVLLKKNFY